MNIVGREMEKLFDLVSGAQASKFLCQLSIVIYYEVIFRFFIRATTNIIYKTDTVHLRSQIVADLEHINDRVPQRSVTGAPLFILYKRNNRSNIKSQETFIDSVLGFTIAS